LTGPHGEFSPARQWSTPIEDFSPKVVTVRYVVDAGTRQERTYWFHPADVLQTGLTHPPTGLPLTGFIAVFKPLPVGAHTVDIYVTLSADHSDGFDVDPTADLIAAGKTHWAHYTLEVGHRGHRQPAGGTEDYSPRRTRLSGSTSRPRRRSGWEHLSGASGHGQVCTTRRRCRPCPPAVSRPR
jgi:hypothetical protein